MALLSDAGVGGRGLGGSGGEGGRLMSPVLLLGGGGVLLLVLLLSSLFYCCYYCFIVIVSSSCGGGGSHGNVIIGIDTLTYIIVFIIISIAFASMSNVVSLPQEERDAPGPPEHGTGIVVAPPVRG